MKNIFFIRSPLQAMCAYELSKKFDSDDSNIFCQIHPHSISPKAIIQINNTLNLLDFENVVDMSTENYNLYSRICLLLKIILLRLRLKDKSFRIILGDFNNSITHLARIIYNPIEVIIIDDGFFSYELWRDFLSNGIYFTCRNNVLSNVLKFFNLYKKLEKSPVTLFSVYSSYIKSSNIKVNDFSEIKKLFNVKDKKINSDLVFVIGNKLSERGALSIKDELWHLIKIYNFWKKQGKHITYIAKRTSSESKLNSIEHLGYKVLIPEYPIELDLLLSDFLPKYICGYGFSTIFSTLPLFFPDLRYFNTKFPTDKFSYSSDVEQYLGFVELSKKSKYIEWIDV